MYAHTQFLRTKLVYTYSILMSQVNIKILLSILMYVNNYALSLLGIGSYVRIARGGINDASCQLHKVDVSLGLEVTSRMRHHPISLVVVTRKRRIRRKILASLPSQNNASFFLLLSLFLGVIPNII